MTDIVLASGSRSRREILERAGIPFRVMRPDVDEDALKLQLTEKSPADLAIALAEAKGLSLDLPGAIVIGADQVMEFEGQPFDKPGSMDELRSRLLDMAGKPHHLRGGVILVRNGSVIERIRETSTLWMRNVSRSEVDSYLETVGEDVLSTVGGYMLEGLGVRLFDRVDGDFFSILGLPLFPVLRVLRREGAIPW
ncbi:Maf family protein [Parvularcula lutaonensis]|uniref:Nucleoside triphosphate pyrophosphatase n=1 Tax=Parvularcula lutaonensis TaxID=491923 RepID=A0ABV7M9D7_9PROT|nr:nucleoside triphosphate pyrophosphatase [Parvularcula lutaonensis]GGY46505.1 Maf-like protein [Parvularcula lutaonensis]